MKNTYYLLGHDAIETISESGLQALLDLIIERLIIHNDWMCDVVCIGPTSDPDEIMETICGYTDYFKIDKTMYDSITKALNNETI